MEDQTLKYKDELFIDFHAWKTKPLEDRCQTKTVTLSVTNKSTLLDANIALKEIISEHIQGGTVMLMSEMKTMLYVAALILEGEKDQFDLSKVEASPQDPDHAIKINIQKIMKWLAQLIAVVSNGSALNQKFKLYPRKQPIQ